MTRPGRRCRPLLPGAVLLSAALTGCTGSSAGGGDPAADDSRLFASVAQYRFDEGTRRLKAGVTNNGGRGIRVTRAGIDWDGLDFAQVRLPDEPVLPGQTAAFTIAYGEPRCARRAESPPVLTAVVDGGSRRLPLHVDSPGLLDRLRAKACAEQRLDGWPR